MKTKLIVLSEADPGMEGILIGQGKIDDPPIDQKVEEPEEYDADEQIVGGVDLEKQQKNKQAENIGTCVLISDETGKKHDETKETETSVNSYLR